jgi:pimeloyl-ACP methyl ester carboxylesterase
MRGFLETTSGIELFYEQHGSGQPIVLIHGLFGVTEHWQHQLAPFSRQNRLIAYDLRGSGRSSKPASELYPIPEHVDDLCQLLDGLSIDEPAVVVGHSMGSCVAIELALTHPKRVAGLCLVDGFACGEHCIVNFDEMKEGVAKHANRVALFQRVSFGAAFRWHPHGHTLATWAAEEAAKLPLETIYASARGFTEYDARPNLLSIKVPTLVIVGDQDWSCPLDPSSKFIADNVGGPSDLAVLHSGHFPMLEVAPEFNERLGSWLEQRIDNPK